MKILMLSHGYPPVISGVTLVVQKVAREMVRRGHQVTVVTASDRGPAYQDEDQGVQLMRVHSRPNPFWSEGRLPILSYDKLKDIVADVEPDIINTHDGALLSIHLYRLEREKCHVPELLTCHYLPHFVTYYVHAGNVVERAVEDITWEVTLRMINGFDHVIFPTRTQQQAFIEEGLEKPSTVISNGLDISHYSPDGGPDQEIEARYALPPGPRILFVGRLAKDKKIDVLIRAMPAIWSAHRGHLILVGRGDARQQLAELAERLGVQDCVHFLGFVPEEDLPGLYRHCDIFAIASDVEVQSIPTLQAAATGLPIVAAKAAALPELVENGANGYLVPPGDPSAFAFALQQILDHPELATRFGQASLDIGYRHAEEHTFHAYESLYRAYSLAKPECL
ncbi:MAG: glycosyltransferase [Anaerolineae bacterium]